MWQEKVARSLLQAGRDRTALSGTALNDFTHKCTTVKIGYAIQHEQVCAQPLHLVGWKVGATSKSVQDSLGFGPFYGPLFKERCRILQVSNQVQGPVAVSLSSCGVQFKATEAEFAFFLNDDLPLKECSKSGENDLYSEQEVWDKVACVAPSVEFAASRVIGALSPAHIVADGALNGAVVVGKDRFRPVDINGGDWKSLSDVNVSLEINGKEVATGAGSSVLGNPLTSLTWLANSLILEGKELKKGQFVMTGAALMHGTAQPGGKLENGDNISVRFTGLSTSYGGKGDDISITITE